MSNFLSKEVPLAFLINPFYIYCATFSLSIFLYLWGWSSLYPEFSYPLILYFIITFGISIILGRISGKFRILEFIKEPKSRNHFLLLDLIFLVIILMGILDVYLTGYIPVLDRSRNHLDFGFPVIDPIFSSLSIFFSVFFFQTFLESRRKRYFIYFILLIVFQLLIFRRSTVIWILTASVIIFILDRKRLKTIVLLICFLSIPLISFGFGIYGNFRNNLGKSYVMNDLAPAERFKNSGINPNHYLTYLYFSSPLANLQSNVNHEDGFTNNGKLRDFMFNCILPQSLTLRLKDPLKLPVPEYSLIHPHLIAGSFLLVSYSTLGWLGMIFMFFLLILYIITCTVIIRRWNTFSLTTYAILLTTVSLLTFSNFLNRLDVLLTLFVYPVIFHFVFKSANSDLPAQELN